jgi:zinc D-Ala-D-Ala carboxypeptidase
MSELKYFKREEFKCSHTGEEAMSSVFLARLDALREACGFPFRITSGYRSDTHPAEAVKRQGGTHTRGIAADIAVADARQRYIIVVNALRLGFTGIGVARGFVHVDTRAGDPALWTYK